MVPEMSTLSPSAVGLTDDCSATIWMRHVTARPELHHVNTSFRVLRPFLDQPQNLPIRLAHPAPIQAVIPLPCASPHFLDSPKITSASAYWRWLRKRTGTKATPWAGQSMSKGSRRSADKSKRPFTDEEVVRLLVGGAGAELADAMRVAALSGMRLEEIYTLTADDRTGGWFRVRAAKARAGVRRVPIHADLAAIVTRRCEGAEPASYLFPEAGPAREDRGRSMGPSKRSGRYRQACGVHEREDGARHSRVDFHSFRRWFVTAAWNARIDRAVVAAVVGHEVGNITDDTYSGGPHDALLRACVDAVRLPARWRSEGGENG